MADTRPAPLVLRAAEHGRLHCSRGWEAAMKQFAFAQVIGLFLVFAPSARADIFQWEYIHPADPSQGKQQSTTLAHDGAGVSAVSGAYLDGRNLTMAYLIGANLTNASGDNANLTNADLSQANLTNASFEGATLT